MGKTAAILQSDYIPWRGYFDIVRRVDVFVLYDCVQYTKDDWRNRNRIKTARGVRWLTIPVATSGRFGQAVEQAEVATESWVDRHIDTIRANYEAAAGWQAHGPWLIETLREAARSRRLSRINEHLLRRICDRVGIDSTRIVRSEHVVPSRDLMALPRTRRLVRLCEALGATESLSGTAARAYLDEPQLAGAGIELRWMAYPDYPAYPQLWGAFDPRLSIVDLLLNVADGHGAYIR